jgi:hypothetical protein
MNAERLAAANPVSMLDDQPVLVTEFVVDKSPGRARWVLKDVGDTLGCLHSLSLDDLPKRDGGSLHHMPGFEGLPGEDIRLAHAILGGIEPKLPGKNREAFDSLRAI